ncbi:unnamed protein product [Rotaria socialis]|uniref:Large ribosomal subunit protein bL19m n=4 Tax=Rotaria TaxID=231623 RepID=A0A820EFP4_9BILA|nr:unnamed protein product [Rotaria socialis]CAF3565261.1 unnamed protein product [Rotaria socialis]CAF4245933.1 unnamed protein product [Rotaria socialis]CAF4510809.1 unnamed protein product [Rotaria socialis]
MRILFGNQKFFNRNLRYVSSKSISYKDTLNMPKSKFASTMKNRIKCENDIRQKFPVNQLWEWQAKQIRRPLFVLHDGPPFANGPLHIGHFLNKIQKDIIVRYKLLNGHRLDFRPGWDCHGLPIELKALQENKRNSNDKDRIIVRKLARQFATEALEKQKQDFQSWGILADWNNCYRTFDKEFIVDQLRLFWRLYQKGFLYRQYKPVNWSPSVQSALAESELEYNDKHRSTAIYVRFHLQNNELLSKLLSQTNLGNIYVLIWTTTPWSLLGNQAVAVNEKLKYVFVKLSSTNDIYIVAESLLNNIKKFAPFSNNQFEIIGNCLGSELSGLSYNHPIYNDQQKYPIVISDHVTDELGTGLVHIAPAHGSDDFLLSIKHNLQCVNAVNLAGHLNCPSIESLHGRNALDTSDGIQAILKHLNSDVLHHYEFIHSYPYDWRAKKPVLILGSQQWFIDTTRLRDNARKYIVDNVTIFPEGAEKSFLSMTAQRPYWCISRQRCWGVPIPAFYTKDDRKELVINEEIIEHLIKCIQQKDSIDFWWSSDDIKELLPASMHNQAENLERGKDIFDVWFDSGSSFNSVLKDFNCQADLYCEGHDQFNGWFLSSLLLSTAIQSRAPFSNIFVHGFVVDKNNQKMSKSIGNVIQPSEMIFGGGKEKFSENGFDVCREWVTRESYKPQCKTSNEDLNKANKRIYDIRNVFKFLIGNLYDFEPDKHSISNENLAALDRYMAYRLHQILTTYHTDFDQYKMYHGLIAVEDFLQGDISSFYCSVTKDRLYCDPSDSYLRRSTQTVFYLLLKCLNERLAPVMPYLAQELHNELSVIENKQNKINDVFEHKFTILNNELSEIPPELASAMSIVLHLRDTYHGILQNRRPILFDILLHLSDRAKLQFKQLQDVLGKHPSTAKLNFWRPLEELLRCSRVHERSLSDLETDLTEENISSVDLPLLDDKFNYIMKIQYNSLHSCPRCRLQVSEKENELCVRCFTYSQKCIFKNKIEQQQKMALSFSTANKFLLNNQQILRSVLISSVRYKQRGHIPDNLVEHHRQSPLGKLKAGAAVGAFPPKNDTDKDLRSTPHDFKYVFPDFLPNPLPYLRDRILERLERRDMFRRRQQIDIPEFYVGSVLAVTSADPYAPNRRHRFVGICLQRERHGLKHQFTLRNIVDGLGVEIIYELYNPTITKIEVLKLERRLDDNLAYLRDAPPEYCTFPFDMEPVKLPPGAGVPLNTIQVPITSTHWQYKWERHDLKGVLLPSLPRSVRKGAKRYAEPWRQWDIMRQYRSEIHDDEKAEIYEDIEKHKGDLAQYRIDSKENVKITRARPKSGARKAIFNDSKQSNTSTTQ